MSDTCTALQVKERKEKVLSVLFLPCVFFSKSSPRFKLKNGKTAHSEANHLTVFVTASLLEVWLGPHGKSEVLCTLLHPRTPVPAFRCCYFIVSVTPVQSRPPTPGDVLIRRKNVDSAVLNFQLLVFPLQRLFFFFKLRLFALPQQLRCFELSVRALQEK